MWSGAKDWRQQTAVWQDAGTAFRFITSGMMLFIVFLTDRAAEAVAG